MTTTPNPKGEKREYSENRKPYNRSSSRAPRKKVCPFLLDKKLVLDYKNLKIIYRFVTDTGRIVPRRVSGVSAKRQRQLTKHIKRARNVGLIAPTMENL